MSARTRKFPIQSLLGRFRVPLAAGVACAAGIASAATGPENALLVVNADSWASTAIANEYIVTRRIPPPNVVRLRNLPSFEYMNVEDFRTKILGPLLRTAELRGIAPQLDCVIFSADFPWAIDVRADMAGKQFSKAISQPASITGLTYFYQFTMRKDPNYLGLNANFYCRQPLLTSIQAPWSEEDRNAYLAAIAALREKPAPPFKAPDKNLPSPPKLSTSPPSEESALQPILEKLTELRKRHPASTELHYNIACIQARLGNSDAAINALRGAVDNGWWDMRTAAADPDLASIRGSEDFVNLAKRAKLVKFDLAPTMGFRGSAGWQPNGQWAEPGKGIHYMLSTVLACTSGRGNSVNEAIASLQRSAGADGSRPKGTIYFMRNNDVRSTTREWGFQRAAEKLRETGVWTEILDGVLPKGKGDVAGVTIGSAEYSWPASGSRLLPGAIGDNLTSYSGAMGESDGQTPLTEFIRNGAAGASGAVTEPYAIQAKFPSPFIHFHYAQGCSLAEAYFQSLAGPYQLLIVGDALCVPWKKDLTVQAGELKSGTILKGHTVISATSVSKDGITPGAFEFYLDGRRAAAALPGKPFDLNTAEIPDGPHEIVITALGSDGPLTRGSVRVPVVVKNGETELRVTAPPASVPWDRPIEITASAPGAKTIRFFQNLDEVARIEGESGTARIDPRMLGQGPVRIQPLAVLSETKQILGELIAVRIKPPAALPARAAAARLVCADGFTVTNSGGKKSTVQKADGDWLKNAGVQDGEAFSVEAWFNVAATDVYQFQLRGAADLRISVDGQVQSWPHGTEWWFVPVHLEAGRHTVRIEGRANGEKLDVRFGGPGSRRLDGAHFQHPEGN